MADKTISELPAATEINPADLFVLQQQATNSARSLQGQVLVAWLTQYADGHGGIQGIAKTSTSGLVDTYTISYADGTVGTFTVTNGAKGDTGAQTYVWIKWAAQNPTADNQLSNNPDKWIGIYTGTASTAPTTRTSYKWYEYKGEKGDQGDAVTAVVQTGGTGDPGSTDTYTMYVGSTAIGTFDVYNGLNGTGAVNTVNGVSPDGSGNVNVMPTGGSAGDMLVKASASDFNTAWVAPPTWSYVGTATGSNAVSLPNTDWTELYVKSYFGLNGAVCFEDYIPRIAIEDTAGKWYLHGAYGGAGDYHSMTLEVTASGVKLNTWTYNGASQLASSSVKVWVR